MKTLEPDYLVIGAGAMGMAFADTLLTETDATVVMVDRYHQPGGHWTTAYPYVRLHQPSAFYGVNSKPLGSDRIDQTGWNAGLYELATCGEVCAYFDQVMQQQLLPSGRVEYFPMCEYEGDGRFHSVVSGEEFTVAARRRIVDATYMRVIVPSMRVPPYEIVGDVECVAPNELPRLRRRHPRYTVVGAGKTGMDACLWLLRQGVDPATISWIMPRDSWLLDRARIQPGAQFVPAILAGMAAQFRAIADATSIDDLFDGLVECGQLLRLSDAVRPTMYRCATVTTAELEQLRRITDVVRLGRVRRIEAAVLLLDSGTIPAQPGTLYIDCSADGLQRRPALPVFDGKHITLQSVRTCQQVFSAALIAHVEAQYTDDAMKNDICVPVPHPDSDLDWLRTSIANGRNELRWAEDAGMQTWLGNARLQLFRNLMPPPPADPKARAVAARQQRAGMPAQRAKLTQLLEASAG